MYYKISLGGMPQSTTRKRIEEVGSAYGEVKDVFLTQDLRTGASLGSGFIQYACKEDDITAAKASHGFELDGKKVEAYESIMG